jgi:hypothetical protein
MVEAMVPEPRVVAAARRDHSVRPDQERVIRLFAQASDRLDLLMITAPVRQELPFDTRRLTLHEGRLK